MKTTNAIPHRMRKNCFALIGAAALVMLFTYGVSSEKSVFKKQKRSPLPGCIQIAENLYYDQYEMSRIDWSEYQHWLKRVFHSSDSIITCVQYRHFPIVGITQEQARAYSKWRSDRVFENMLVKMKVIDRQNEENSDNYFTIERFFEGKIPKKKKVDIVYYPEYSLPTIAEYEQALQYCDSVVRCKPKKYSIIIDENTSDNKARLYIPIDTTFATFPFRPVFDDVISPLKFIKGNINEWLDEANTIGIGVRQDVLPNMLTMTINPDDSIHLLTTGFRNVCRWKKWE